MFKPLEVIPTCSHDGELGPQIYLHWGLTDNHYGFLNTFKIQVQLNLIFHPNHNELKPPFMFFIYLMAVTSYIC